MKIPSIKCLIGDHDWTCKAELGIEPPPIDREKIIEQFTEYSRPFCSRCGKQMIRPHERKR